jgi:hypothetical protein
VDAAGASAWLVLGCSSALATTMRAGMGLDSTTLREDARCGCTARIVGLLVIDCMVLM